MIEKTTYDNGLTSPHHVIDLRNTETDETITLSESQYHWYTTRGMDDADIFQFGCQMDEQKRIEERFDAAVTRFSQTLRRARYV
jgi:hypothetical protein